MTLASYELPPGMAVRKVHLSTHPTTATYPGQTCNSPYCPQPSVQVDDEIVRAFFDDQVGAGVMHVVCVEAAQRRVVELHEAAAARPCTLDWSQPMPRDEAMAMCRDKRYAMQRTGEPGRGRSWHVALVNP